jgi:hypothetical protein
MALGTGVELEWAIVYYSLVNGGVSPSELKERNRKAQGKIQPYASVKEQAIRAVKLVESEIGKSNLKYCYHSDEYKGGISGIPEPKTDVVYDTKIKLYKCSVKMDGPVQLASGQGKSTAKVFQLVAENVGSGTVPKNLKTLIADLEGLPTRLASVSNIQRIKQDARLAKEFIKGKNITKDKLYEGWLENNKPALMKSLMNYVTKDKDFAFALIKEAMTGDLLFKDNKLAAANYILTPNEFVPITDQYVRSKLPKVKLDIRAKSRSGVTSIAFRIDLKA